MVAFLRVRAFLQNVHLVLPQRGHETGQSLIDDAENGGQMDEDGRGKAVEVTPCTEIA
jgi:hypothetical protein